MKQINFTAIYDTESMQGLEYAFTAKDLAHAIDYCKWKFSVKRLTLRVDDSGVSFAVDNEKGVLL